MPRIPYQGDSISGCVMDMFAAAILEYGRVGRGLQPEMGPTITRLEEIFVRGAEHYRLYPITPDSPFSELRTREEHDAVIKSAADSAAAALDAKYPADSAHAETVDLEDAANGEVIDDAAIAAAERGVEDELDDAEDISDSAE